MEFSLKIATKAMAADRTRNPQSVALIMNRKIWDVTASHLKS